MKCQPASLTTRAAAPVEVVISRRSVKTGVAGIAQAVAAWRGAGEVAVADVSRALTALPGRTKRVLERQRKAWQRRFASWRGSAGRVRRRFAKSAMARALAARSRRAKAVLAQARKSWMLALKRGAASLSRSHTAWISGITSALALTLIGLFVWMSWHSRHIVLSDT